MNDKSKDKNNAGTKTIDEVTRPRIDFANIDKSPENGSLVGDFYQNTKYKFRLNIPEGWKEYPGGAAHTVFKTGNKPIGASLTVTLMQYDEADLEHYLHSEQERLELLGSIQVATESQMITPENLNVSKSFLYNFPSYTIKYNYLMRAFGGELEYTMLQIMCVRFGGLYTISINMPNQFWDERMDRTVINSINSFRFDI